MDIDIKKLSPQDNDEFSALISIFENVFHLDNFTMPDEKHLQNLLLKPDFFAMVASHQNKVVGGLTVYVLHRYYSIQPIAYIYDLGVLPAYQRKGIGKKLIAYLTDYCKENGFEDVYVQAETADIQAINFYRTTFYSSELQATHFTYSFNRVKTEQDPPQ